MRRLALAFLIALTAAPAVARDIPAAAPAGKPLNCIPLHQIRETRVRSDGVIDFIMAGRNQVYRNTLPNGGCPSLGFEERFTYTTSLSVLCSTDIITVLRVAPTMAGPSCGLGQFQPVTLAAR